MRLEGANDKWIAQLRVAEWTTKQTKEMAICVRSRSSFFVFFAFFVASSVMTAIRFAASAVVFYRSLLGEWRDTGLP